MYKAILYDNGKFEMQVVSDEECKGETTSVYSFYYKGKGTGSFAVRDTEEKAAKALLESMNTAIKEKEMEIKRLKSKAKVIDSYVPKPNRCWMCKHWGTVTAWGTPYHYANGLKVSPEDAHKNAVVQFKGSTAPCPFQLIKTGKRPRCMPCYNLACEHFEKYE